MTSFIWVIGAPRSGTTALTEYLGNYTDLSYMEPWETHKINDFESWKFPECKSLVFKYCYNWFYASRILEKFVDSKFIHYYYQNKDA
jgi:hypothetical protein